MRLVMSCYIRLVRFSLSRPIQGDDDDRAGLRFAKWTWTLGSVNRPALCGGFVLAERETVGIQLADACERRCHGLVPR